MYNKTALLAKLSDKLTHHLPSPFQNQVSLASFENGTMTLAVKDNAVSAKLRFYLPTLRDQLRKEEKLYTLRNIKIIMT